MERAKQIVSQLVPSVDSESKSPLQSEYQKMIKNVDRKKAYDSLANLPSGSLKGKTIFITGASRGIGLAIALRAAQDGANIALAAKTVKEDPRLPGTIFSAAQEIEKAGGKALPLPCDIRNEEQVYQAVKKTVETFGGIDIVVNNASAISLTDTEHTSMKKFDLMMSVNARGSFLVTKAALPFLKLSATPQILMLSPPLSIEGKWFGPHVAYSIAKYGMSLLVLGMSEEFKEFGINVNALWPLTTIATAAVQNLLGGDSLVSRSRTPAIMGEAAYHILTAPRGKLTGGFWIDDFVLRAKGESDFSKYRVSPTTKEEDLALDFFL